MKCASIKILNLSLFIGFGFVLQACCSGKKISFENEALLAPNLIMNPSGALSKGTKPHQGIPSIAVSSSGKRTFAAWYGGSWDETSYNYVMMAYSSDLGENWSKVKMVVRSPYCGRVRCFDPALWRDPDGKIWLFWAQSGEGLYYDMRAGVWASVCENPDANEPLWSAPRRLADGVMMNNPEVLSNGDWAFPVGGFSPDFGKSFPKDKAPSKPDIEGVWLYVSKDKGKTLHPVSKFQVPSPRFPEHMFLAKRNGDIMCYIRRDSSQIITTYKRKEGLVHHSGVQNGIVEAVSKDGGKTWGNCKFSDIPHPSSRFHVRRLKSGNILLIKNYAFDDEWVDKGKLEPKVEVLRRNKMMAYISEDDGLTWKGGLELDDRLGVSYPDASQADDGTIIAIYDRDRFKEQEIICARFTEDDIFAGKLVNKNSKLKILVNKGETFYEKPSGYIQRE